MKKVRVNAVIEVEIETNEKNIDENISMVVDDTLVGKNFNVNNVEIIDYKIMKKV